MPRKAHQKNGYLEQREDGYYRVTMGVPKPLQPQLGNRLKQALGTKSLIEANDRKKIVIQEFRARNQVRGFERLRGDRRSQLFRLHFHRYCGAASTTRARFDTVSMRRKIEADISRRNSFASKSRSLLRPMASAGGAT